MQARFHSQYIPLIALAILALLFALWAGLLRLGWQLPSLSGLSLAHGPLMVSGFVGTLIALERAVALRQKWMFVPPIATGLGSIGLLIYPSIGALLVAAGSLGTVAILGIMVRREPRLHTATMAVGAVAWAVGNLIWASGESIFQIVYWWQAFLILTIGGERLELSRVLRPTATQSRLFALAAAGLLGGTILTMLARAQGARLSGLSLVALSLWLLKNDIARRNIHHPAPLTHYIALCLYAGFIWLGIGGILQVYFGAVYAGLQYDATLHCVFVGFVISMIFGHAPMIFPAILGTPIAFLRAFYLQLILLHASLVVRIAGDLSGSILVRQWGGLLNEVAILLFLGATIYAIVHGRRGQA